MGCSSNARPFLYLYAMPDSLLLHIRLNLRRRGTDPPTCAAVHYPTLRKGKINTTPQGRGMNNNPIRVDNTSSA